MTDERLGQDAGEWLRDIDAAPPDPHLSVQQAMTQIRKTRQVRRWWPPAFRMRGDAPVSDISTAEYQPNPIPATNGYTPTAIGRTRSMLSPVKAITTGALVFAIGGAFLIGGASLIGQPFQQESNVPGAATDATSEAPVEFTAHISAGSGSDCSVFGAESVVDGVAQLRGTRCQIPVEDSSDPRFAGTWSFVYSEDHYGMGPEVRTGTAEGAPTVWTVEYRVENDEGAWQSSPISGIEFAEREMMVAPVFIGEGAYEGLTAIVELSDRETDVASGDSDASLRGAIFGGSPPPTSGFPPTE